MTDAIMMYIDGVRTRASGDVVLSLSVDQSQAAKLQRLMTMVGQPIGVAFAEVGKEQTGVEPPDNSYGMKSMVGETTQDFKKENDLRVLPYGQQAKALRLSGFFRSPEVWKHIGTDTQFRLWVQNQPSCITANQDATDAGPKCEAAHVRRAGESGTGHKALYACVPLTHEEHAYQHQHGELETLWKYIGEDDEKNRVVDVEGAKDWFNKKRIEYVRAWCWETLKKDLNYESWGDVPPDVIFDWAKERNIEQYLPDLGL